MPRLEAEERRKMIYQRRKTSLEPLNEISPFQNCSEDLRDLGLAGELKLECARGHWDPVPTEQAGWGLEVCISSELPGEASRQSADLTWSSSGCYFTDKTSEASEAQEE